MIALTRMQQSDVKQRRKTILSLTEQFVTQTCGHRPPSHSDLHMRTVKNNALWITETLRIGLSTIFLSLIMSIVYWIQTTFDPSVLSSVLFPILCFALYYTLKRFIDPEALLFIVQIVAWLHDVNDHKYSSEDPTLYPNLITFLDQITSKDQDLNGCYDVLTGTPYEYLYTTKMILALTERISFSRQKKSHEQTGTQDWLKILGRYGVIVRNIVSDADKFEAIGEVGIDRCAQYTAEVFEKTGQTPTKSAIAEAVIKHYHEKLKLLASPVYIKTVPGLGYAMYLDHQMKRYLERMIREKDTEDSKLN